jgi:hypothetical protein
VTAVVKRIASYFVEDVEHRQQQPEGSIDKDTLEDSISELPTYSGAEHGEAAEAAGTLDERRSSSLVPLLTPELWNAEKAVQSEIDALEQALRRMADSKESSFDLGIVTNPYSIFQVHLHAHHLICPRPSSLTLHTRQFMVTKLKQLHVPLLTFKLEPSFLAIAGTPARANVVVSYCSDTEPFVVRTTLVALVDPAQRIEQYRNLLRTSVPSDCFQKIRALLPLLRRLEAHHERNGMTHAQLGQVFAPIFLRGRMEKTPSEIVRDKHLVRTLVRPFAFVLFVCCFVLLFTHLRLFSWRTL